MKSSRQLAVVLSIIAVMPAVPAGLAFVKDPYQIIRPRAGGELRLRSNTRFQNAGLIRNFLGDPEQGFDTIIMGASHAAEYRPSEIRSAIGINRAMNLSMVGGRPQVQLAVMRRALREPTVKKVIWSLSHS